MTDTRPSTRGRGSASPEARGDCPTPAPDAAGARGVRPARGRPTARDGHARADARAKSARPADPRAKGPPPKARRKATTKGAAVAVSRRAVRRAATAIDEGVACHDAAATGATPGAAKAPERKHSGRDASVALAARVQSLEADLAHERRASRALRDVGIAIGSVAELDRILELILSKIQEVLEAERATLFLMDHARNELVSRLVVGESVQAIRVKVGRGIAGVVARTGKPLRVEDAYRDKRFSREWDELTGYRTRSILAAPMKNHLGRTIGVVQALNKHGGPFTVDDENLLTVLATQAAITVDNSRLYLSAVQKNVQLIETKEQLERRVRDLKLLFDLESAMGRATTLDELLRAALVEAARACEAGSGAVSLPDEVTGRATVHVLEVGEPDRLRRTVLGPGEGFLGRVVASGEATTAVSIPPAKGAHVTPTVDERALGVHAQSAVGVPLEGQNGGAIGAVALFDKNDARAFSDEDVSLLRLVAANLSTSVQLFRSREAQERAERLTTIGRLLSSVIHDLKTPMTVISGYVQMMATTDDREQREAYSEHILKQFDLVQQMQKEVLEFARGQTSLLVRRVYLQNFMREIEQSLRPSVAGTRVTLRVDVADRGTARFDEGKVTRALHNFVRNATEAMGERGGELTVRVARENSDVVFSVSDTGPGVPSDVRGRLFEAFVTSGKKGGTGLGLAIVKKIADDHGGRVEVETSPHGATFRLVLPQPPR